MTARRTGTLAVASVAAGALLVVLLVAWAASIGPSEVLRGEGFAQPSESAATATATATDEPADAGPAVEPPEDPGRSLVGTLAVVLNVLLVVGLVLLAGWVTVRTARSWRRERRRRTAEQAPAFEVVPPPVLAARELLDGAEAQRHALTGDTPRNAVVACWSRFESAAAAAGIERHTWETSSEHVLRVLDLVDADSTAVARLSDLYREARFSEHDLDEDDRAAALDALDRIHRSIGARA